MKDLIKHGILTVAIMALLLFGLTVASLFMPKNDFSASERRFLAKYPKITLSGISEGDFTKDFEKASLDQFPERDGLRTLKAIFSYYVFGRLDNNGIYFHDGYAAKREYPISESSLDYAASRFRALYKKYMEGTDVRLYFSVIPDKSRYFAKGKGILTMDHEAFDAAMRERVGYMTYIDIADTLSLEAYYKTDTHWRQERILNTAERLAAMGSAVSEEHLEHLLDEPFYGVYCGQSALPLPPEEIHYLTNEVIDSYTVTIYDAAKPYTAEVYDMEKAHGRDPYEMFLSGPISLLTIDNPLAKTERELVIFRDSFGSSIAPLLAEGYKRVTLVDIRYLSSELVGRFVTFDKQDVLFLYSTIVLNNSVTLK